MVCFKESTQGATQQSSGQMYTAVEDLEDEGMQLIYLIGSSHRIPLL